LSKRLELLQQVQVLSDLLNFRSFPEFTCERAIFFFKFELVSRWKEFEQKINLYNELTKVENEKEKKQKGTVTMAEAAKEAVSDLTDNEGKANLVMKHFPFKRALSYLLKGVVN
jgi:hypothetical protein